MKKQAVRSGHRVSNNPTTNLKPQWPAAPAAQKSRSARSAKLPTPKRLSQSGQTQPQQYQRRRFWHAAHLAGRNIAVTNRPRNAFRSGPTAEMANFQAVMKQW